VCKAHRLLHHSTLGLRVIKKKKMANVGRLSIGTALGITLRPYGLSTLGPMDYPLMGIHEIPR